MTEKEYNKEYRKKHQLHIIELNNKEKLKQYDRENKERFKIRIQGYHKKYYQFLKIKY